MTNSLTHIKEECKKISSILNIDMYDVFGIIKEDNSASSKEKRPFALASSNKSFVTLRVWNQNKHVGITTTSNLTKEGLFSAFEIALSSAQFCDPNTSYEFSPLCLQEIEINNLDQQSNFVSIQELSKAVIECETNILNSHSSIKSVPYNKISQSHCEQFYFNSQDAFRHQTISTSHCYFYPLAQEENKIPRQLGHVTLANNFKNLDYLGCAKTAIEKTINHLNYEKVATGKYTVVFSSEAFLDLIGAFSNFFNAQNVLDNKSLSNKESINTQISAKFLTIIDSPLHKEHIGKSYFDEEGTPTSELAIVEDGVLKNFIHTSYTAKIFNTKPTGHTSLSSKLTAHPHFLRVFASPNYSNQKAEINTSIIIYVDNVKALHAGINALQGSFSLPFDGFIMEGEKKISIESATVAGDFLSLLKNITYVSPQEKVTPSGICSEEIWVNNLSVTGN